MARLGIYILFIETPRIRRQSIISGGGSEYSRKADPGSLPIRTSGETEEF
jgi:hypothetical protein